jgi:hypothetical protein
MPSERQLLLGACRAIRKLPKDQAMEVILIGASRGHPLLRARLREMFEPRIAGAPEQYRARLTRVLEAAIGGEATMRALLEEDAAAARLTTALRALPVEKAIEVILESQRRRPGLIDPRLRTLLEGAIARAPEADRARLAGELDALFAEAEGTP